MSLYFAYGSNLDPEELPRFARDRGVPLGRYEALAPAYLPDRELSFGVESKVRAGGALDVPRRLGAVVPGVLFEVDQTTLALLDIKEGRRGGRYLAFEAMVLTSDGAMHRAVSYEVAAGFRIRHHVDPTEDYVATVRRGYAAHGIDGRHLERALQDQRGASLPLFAYGTLLDPRRRGRRFPNALPGEPGTIRGQLFDFGCYPGVRLGHEGVVHGQLMTHPELAEMMPRVDAYEDFLGWDQVEASLYRRAIVEVQTHAATRLAWAYVYLDGGGALIPEGRWLGPSPRAE